MYIPKYFKTYELVPKKIEEMFENDIVKFKMIDESCLRFLDLCRERYGPLIVNDYKIGGDNQWRGLRTPDSKYYKSGSMHSFGGAIDFVPKNITAQEVIADLKKNRKNKDFLELITRVEDKKDMNWVHFDNKPTFKKEIYFFKP